MRNKETNPVQAHFVRPYKDVLERHIQAFARDITLRSLLDLLDVSFPNTGLIMGDRIHDFVSRYVLDKCLEESSIPFRCVATNFLSKKEVILQTGLMADAVRASISIPGIFVPVRQEGNIFLVDGGVVNPVPVSVVQAMGADIVIAVNLNKDPKTKKAHADDSAEHSAKSPSSESATDSIPGDEAEAGNRSGQSLEKPSTEGYADDSESEENGFLSTLSNRYDALKDILQDEVDAWIPDPKEGLNIFDVLGNSINVMEQRVTEANLQIDRPDILIEPNLIEFGIFDFHQAQPMIQRGYEAAEDALPDIRKYE
jgi:NTE family protein